MVLKQQKLIVQFWKSKQSLFFQKKGEMKMTQWTFADMRTAEQARAVMNSFETRKINEIKDLIAKYIQKAAMEAKASVSITYTDISEKEQIKHIVEEVESSYKRLGYSINTSITVGYEIELVFNISWKEEK